MKIGGEILVGKTCIDCGEIIVGDDKKRFQHKLRHTSCAKIHKQLLSKNRYVPKEHFQYTCRLCNNTFESSEINQWGKQVICKSCRAKINPNSVNNRKITVAVTCIECGEIIMSSSANRRYCDNCISSVNIILNKNRAIKDLISDSKSLTPKERYDKTKELFNNKL